MVITIIGLVLSAVGKWLPDLWKAKLEYELEKRKSENERRKIDSNERIENYKTQMHERGLAKKAMATVLIAEQSNFWNWVVRPLFAIPTGIYYAKIILVDKLLPFGTTTDPLFGQVGQWADAIVYSYFFVEGATMTARIVGNRFGNKTPAPQLLPPATVQQVVRPKSPTDASDGLIKGQ